MCKRCVDSAEWAEVFMKVEDQLRAAELGQFLIPLDLRIGGVDDYSQMINGGAGRGERPLNHRDAFNLQPGLVPIHSRTSAAGLNEPSDCGLSHSVHDVLPPLRRANYVPIMCQLCANYVPIM